ncbi:hypothetical protein [Anaplasma bovis]|uniref:hypothetical protein n=1 Tax=Anaplasma bovis TaxID=186733 RepID=UPI002FF1D2C3
MDREAVEHPHEEEGHRDIVLLDSLLMLVLIANVVENELPTAGQDRKGSLLLATLISLCSTLCRLTYKVDKTGADYRAITIAAQTTYHILNKLQPDKHVYHDLLNSTLKQVLQRRPYSSPTEISSKLSGECSMHGVLHNLAVKLIGDIRDLNSLDGDDADSLNSKLSLLLESLNCTLGSLNRALDPLPGGKYAMEGELYNVHLTPHKLPIVPTLISEPMVSHCCCSYKQLPPPPR